MSLNSDKEKKNEKRKCKTEEKGDVDTSNFSIEERLVSAVWVHERKFDKTSIAQIKINFRKRFGKAAPTKNTLYFWEKKLFSTGKVMDAKRSGRPCRRKAHIPSVEASLQQCPGLSLRARAEQLALPRTTLIKILKEDLHIKHINGSVQNQSGKYSSPEIESPPSQTSKQQQHKPEKSLQQKPQQEVLQQQHIETDQLQQAAIATNNMISCPPPAYPYPDAPASLPFSALQHYLSYPSNKYHNRQQHQQISQIVNPSAPLHSKLQPDPQNYATNVGMAPHMLSHPHQHHVHHVNQHNYQTNPQMIFKYEGFHAQ